ncbi:hypothetical protein HWV62_1701 [Athelia sp. TMB]|nr:hypothetical protein HWV62_1701 [Athelia sp. TMB]
MASASDVQHPDAIQSSVSEVESNKGLAGDIAKAVGGSKRRLTRRRGDIGARRTWRESSGAGCFSAPPCMRVLTPFLVLAETYLSDAEDSEDEGQMARDDASFGRRGRGSTRQTHLGRHKRSRSHSGKRSSSIINLRSAICTLTRTT